jgi:hypothetical protein
MNLKHIAAFGALALTCLQAQAGTTDGSALIPVGTSGGRVDPTPTLDTSGYGKPGSALIPVGQGGGHVDPTPLIGGFNWPVLPIVIPVPGKP